MKILTKKEIKELEGMIAYLYGNKAIFEDLVVLTTGKESKIWVSSKDIFNLDIEKLRINSIGVYFGRIDRGKLRVSVEGAQLIGKTATKNIVNIAEKELWDFLRGFDINEMESINVDSGAYVLVKYKEDWLGIAKVEDGVLKNSLPKSRKILSLSK